MMTERGGESEPRREARLAAALAFLAGAIVTRYAWLAAGRASARDVGALFAMQRGQAKGALSPAAPRRSS